MNEKLKIENRDVEKKSDGVDFFSAQHLLIGNSIELQVFDLIFFRAFKF